MCQSRGFTVLNHSSIDGHGDYVQFFATGTALGNIIVHLPFSVFKMI